MTRGGLVVARIVAAVAALLALWSAANAHAAVTQIDANGTVLLDGHKVFPLVLAKGPDAGTTTPTGTDAIAAVASAGITFLKVGPATVPWTTADIDEANAEDRAAAQNGIYTWVNLATVSTATAGSAHDTLLGQVIGALTSDSGAPAIGMWKGADEPWWSGTAATALRLVFCRSTGRGDPSWCGGEPVLDRDHLWVTIQAPRGTAADLAPYAAVTDVHGVDVYPVTAANPAPDLHQVGTWTSTLASVTPGHSVWTTLQICASGSVRSDGSFVLPTKAQERFMLYDAIINGARSLAFYGGNNPDCWNGTTDNQHGWNWSFWDSTLKDLVSEVDASSPLAPALLDPASTTALPASDTATEVIRRDGGSGDLWVLAAHASTGVQSVTISGLPSSASSADVYTEGRSVPVSGGALTDTFGPWDVHVYHLVAATQPPPAAPTISSVTPSSGPAGTVVTISGSNLAGATAVAFNGTAAGFTSAPSAITATVPAGATSGPLAVTTPGGTATASFTVTSTAPPPPPPPGNGSSGGQAAASDLRLGIAATALTAAVGAMDDVTITAVDAGGGSTGVTLTVDLPAGLTLVAPPAYERGSGCTGDMHLVCNLDFLQPNSPTTVRFSVRATQPGDERVSASIAASQQDANPSDNAASLTISVATSPTAARTPTVAKATQHADRLVGTRGPDTLRGLGGGDTLLGLAGNDVLDGGPGNDTLVGGPGRDLLIGGPGNDVINARDGMRDRIRCGTGRDRVLADRFDAVARDCEIVRRR